MDRPPRASRLLSAGWRLLVATGSSAILAFAIGFCLVEPAPIAASSAAVTDTDADGLTDAQEKVNQTDPDSFDTDGDGFGDGEELARSSDPLDDASQPENVQLGVGMSAHVSDDVMHLQAAFFLEGGDSLGSKFKIGLMHNGVLVTLPPELYLPFADIRLVAGRNPSDLVAVVDIQLPEVLVHDLGDVSTFATVTPEGSTPVAAATGNFASQAGTVVQATPQMPLPGTPPGSRRAIYRPIEDEENVPSKMVPGQVCVQVSQVIGSHGSALRELVSQASCEPTEGGYCSISECGQLVGTTLDVLDPLSLIGG